MLKTRVLTAIIGLPILIGILAFSPPWTFMAMLVLGIIFSVYEISSILIPTLARFVMSNQVEREKVLWLKFPFTLLNILTSLLMFWGIINVDHNFAVVFVFVGLMAVWLPAMIFTQSINASICLYFSNTLSVIYGTFLWTVLWFLKNLPGDYFNILFLLCVVFGSDTGGYFGGRFFGKNKLAPSISPKKTVEGVIGGLVLGIGLGVLLNWISKGVVASYPMVIIIASVGSIVGVFGDLFESTLKRFADVKDSGGIFPGHGGMLDRVDALAFAAPVVWGLLYLLK